MRRNRSPWLLSVHATHVLGSVGEQCHLSCLFDCYAQEALMFGACPGLTTRLDFTTIRDIALDETNSVFVIDLASMIVAELTYFTARCALASWAIASFATRGSFRTSLHRLFSSIFRRGDLLNLQEGRFRLHSLPGTGLNYCFVPI